MTVSKRTNCAHRLNSPCVHHVQTFVVVQYNEIDCRLVGMRCVLTFRLYAAVDVQLTDRNWIVTAPQRLLIVNYRYEVILGP